MATEENEDFIPETTGSDAEAFPTREQLADTKRPDPFDFDEPESSYFDPVPAKAEKSGAPDSKPAVDESDASMLQELAANAKSLGMNDDEVSQIKDPGALRSVIAALQRQAASETADDTKPTGQKPDAGESPSSEYEALAALDPDDAIDPSAIKAIKALKAELDKMRVRQVEKPASPEVRPEEADYLIAKLGEDYVGIFGEGPATTLSKKSGEFRARLQVVEEMKRIQDDARSAKRKVPEAKDAFDQALRSVFGSHVQSVERKRLASQVQRRESQLIARPANNGRRPVSGREKAISNVAAIMRERMQGGVGNAD